MRSDVPALVMDGVGRAFRSSTGVVQAVSELDLSVGRGEVLGVLGPNGAGKTTTIKMAATLLTPTVGHVTVAGIDAVARPRAARRHLGLVLGGDRGFYLRASAAENLSFFAELQGVSRRRSERVAEVLALVGLEGKERSRVETFSRGMRQRLHIARALLADPPLILLDEPSIGLDPEGAHDLRALVRDLRHDDRGVLLTTHYLHEAEVLADRLVVIADGSVVARGSTDDIARMAGVSAVTSVTARGDHDPLDLLTRGDDVADAASTQRNGVWEVTIVWRHPSPDGVLVEAAFAQHEILSRADRAATLEEAYLAFVQRWRAGGSS